MALCLCMRWGRYLCRSARFLIFVSFPLYQICNSSEPACPYAKMDSLVFEMHKQYHENRLQLLLSPLILYVLPQPPCPTATTGASASTNNLLSSQSKVTSSSSQGGSSNVNTSRGSSAHTTNSTGGTALHNSAHTRSHSHPPGFVLLSGLQVSS